MMKKIVLDIQSDIHAHTIVARHAKSEKRKNAE